LHYLIFFIKRGNKTKILQGGFCVKKNSLIIIGVIVAIFIFISFFKKSHIPVVHSSPSKEAQQIFNQAVQMVKNGDLVEAKQSFQKILLEHADYENMAAVQKNLNDINTQIIFSNVASASAVIHEVQPGDTLGKIAKKYNTTIDLIQIRNNIKGNVIRPGQKLSIWTGNLNIFVDKSQNILMLKDGDEVLKIYTVSTGANNSTPVGEFTITTKLINPVWFNKGIVVPPESPQNVLGTRWLGFDLQGYGIHGTVEPETIGQQVTAGCVRMVNEQVEELYTIVPIGTKVKIVD